MFSGYLYKYCIYRPNHKSYTNHLKMAITSLVAVDFLIAEFFAISILTGASFFVETTISRLTSNLLALYSDSSTKVPQYLQYLDSSTICLPHFLHYISFTF